MTPPEPVVCCRAKFAAVSTNPSPTNVEDVGSWRFQSWCASFHEGLVFSMHSLLKWNDGTSGLAPSTWQNGFVLGGMNGNAGSHPGFVGALAGSAGGLNCARPSNGWS